MDEKHLPWIVAGLLGYLWYQQHANTSPPPPSSSPDDGSGSKPWYEDPTKIGEVITDGIDVFKTVKDKLS